MSYVKASRTGPKPTWRLPRGYNPPKGRDVLLLLPCAKSKPYRNSPFHRTVRASLGRLESRIHFCTISETVGIVPAELEDTIPKYDTYPDEAGITRAASYLRRFLRRFARRYKLLVAYATSRTFRAIVRRATGGRRIRINLLPAEGAFSKRSAFFEFIRRRSGIRRFVIAHLATQARLTPTSRQRRAHAT